MLSRSWVRAISSCFSRRRWIVEASINLTPIKVREQFPRRCSAEMKSSSSTELRSLTFVSDIRLSSPSVHHESRSHLHDDMFIFRHDDMRSRRYTVLPLHSHSSTAITRLRDACDRVSSHIVRTSRTHRGSNGIQVVVPSSSLDDTQLA